MFPLFTRPAGFAAQGATTVDDPRFSPTTTSSLGAADMTPLVNLFTYTDSYPQDEFGDPTPLSFDLGVDFPFYGQTYHSDLFVNAHGALMFGQGTMQDGESFPRSVIPALLVEPGYYWYWRRFYIQIGVDRTRVRWEGSLGSGSYPFQWEATFFDNGVIMVTTGSQIMDIYHDLMRFEVTAPDPSVFNSVFPPILGELPANSSGVFLRGVDGNLATFALGSYD